MISQIIRIFIGISGALSIFAAFQHIFTLESVAAERGLSVLSTVGRANFRADIGGIFLVIGIFQLLAAWKSSGQWALAAILAISMTLFGRLISLALDGAGTGVWPPIMIEAVVLAISLSAWRQWKDKKPEGL